MPSVDALLASPPLAGLARVSTRGGSREVTQLRLAEEFADLGEAPAGSLVMLGRAASGSATDYRFDMGMRWAAIRGVAAVAAFSAERWRPPVTAIDIAERADIALVSVPSGIELTGLIQAVMREIGGGAELALARAAAGLAAVTQADAAAADLESLRESAALALGTEIELRAPADDEVGATIAAGEAAVGHLTAPAARGDMAIAARLVLHAAAAAAGRRLDAAARASELPIRSRSGLLSELLMSESALSEDLLERARQLSLPVTGWHIAVRIEADNLAEAGRDEMHRFDLLESAGQVAHQAAAGTGGTWHLAQIPRAIVLICMRSSDPGPQAAAPVIRSAERTLQAIRARLPALVLRAGVGTPHEGPMGLRASAAEARAALLSARAAGKPAGVSAHDATGVHRMLMEWYASDTARAAVRAQLAPLERLEPERRETAIRTLMAFLDHRGSIIRTAQDLHLHRNAVAYRLRWITELLGVDLDDPDQRLALQLACRARLLD
ncbi:MAG: PucR family transcriptional regulator [Streptosporangiaceae bacterium]